MLTLSEIKGVGDATIKKLQELGVKSVFELFSFLPSKYIDLGAPISILNAEAGALNLFEGTVEKVSSVSKRGKHSFSVSFSDNFVTGRKIYFKTTFYNLPYLHDGFSAGDKYRIFGRLSKEEGVFNIVNPQLEKLNKISKLKDIYTVYPLKGILGQNTFKNIILSALAQVNISEYSGRFADINRDMTDTFVRLHAPKSISDAEDARDALASLDLAIVLSIYRKMQNNGQDNRKVFYNNSKFRIVDYIDSLPYDPTPSQLQAFEDIYSDMISDKNMSRIVSGDVGSGKTAVAFFAMLMCAMGGRQCALMAPTEILAKQHYTKFKEIADKFDISYALLTSSAAEAEKRTVLQKLKNGEVSCVIGTQSLISDGIEYADLALAVIDEQHKFGVNERKLLESKGAADILSLTATPIPRSMALTFYEDVAISFIKKRESAKTNVQTVIVDIDAGINKILEACKNGKQAFIVCPSIANSEGYDVMSIECFMRDYGKRFEGINLQVLHGKMSAEQKSQAMSDFSSGKTQVLIATTVVEVGVDTKASEILILEADRFGLASLHQLRGRVGRDGSPAHCLVCSESVSDRATDRLKLFCAYNDGQYLAEADFAMRGAGDFMGTRQSGSSLTPIFGLKMSAEILSDAKKYADRCLKSLNIDELLALTRRSKSRIDEFLSEIGKVTLNS